MNHQREKALKLYYQNPNICFWCKKTIKVRDNEKPSITRTKKFCNSSCNAYSVNQKIKKNRPKPTRQCGRCKNLIERTKRGYNKLCPECWNKELERVGNTKKSETTNSAIRHHAYRVAKKNLDKQKGCSICGYIKHVELCHILEIKSFPPQSLLKDINSIKNLIFLCRNCHWELDHGLLSQTELP